jgi:prolipoprotein diacylglyceryltransferase
MLPLALAFFVVLSYRRLLPCAGEHRSRALLIMLIAIASGVAGAWLHAEWLPAESIKSPRAWLDIRFGSFGGYWGAFLGAIVCARLIGAQALASADAIVPGVLVGGAVARIGCLFAGCCRGAHVAALGAFDPSRIWPAYDLFALLGTAAVVRWIERKPARDSAPGIQLGLCLFTYGALRFMLEFARGLPPVLGPLSSAQVLSAVQIFAGLGVLLFLISKTLAKHT